MRAEISRDKCIKCGACVFICPRVFGMDRDRNIVIIPEEITDEYLGGFYDAMGSCPAGAIGFVEK